MDYNTTPLGLIVIKARTLPSTRGYLAVIGGLLDLHTSKQKTPRNHELERYAKEVSRA